MQGGNKDEKNNNQKRRGRPKKTEQAVIYEDKAPRETVIRRISDDEVRLQQERARIMWVSVGIIMTAIVGFWVYILKTGIDKTSVNAKNNTESLSDMKVNLESQAKQLKESFKIIKTGLDNIKSSTTTLATSSLPIATSSDYNTNVSELNNQLREILKQATSTVNN